MDDETLNRMAIEEIMREMHEAKQLELQKPPERKVNPLGKPNKRFLGRTINSMLTHNKRENERKRRNCSQKLRELDERANQRMRNEFAIEKRNKHSRSKSRSEVGITTFSSSEDSCISKSRRRRLKKIKRKKKTKTRRSISRNRRSTSSDRSTAIFKSKTVLSGRPQEKEEEGEYYCASRSRGEMIYRVNTEMDYYDWINQHYSTIAVYNQMRNIYQSLLASASLTGTELSNARNEWNSVGKEKKSGKPITTTSGSLSSADEDEASVRAINVSTDNESDVVSRRKNKASKESDVELVLSSATDGEYSHNEENMCINLDSDCSHSSSSDSEGSVALISCSSESETLTTGGVEPSKPRHVEEHRSNIMIDLTKE